MANPQKENGFVAVANEIWDILSLIRLTANEHRAIHLVLRLSYGCRQKACQFDRWEDFHCCAGIHKTTVGKILHGLERKNIFLIDWEKRIIAFNKDYSSWNIEPYAAVDPMQYAELIKGNLAAKKDIEAYANILLRKKRSDFAKSELDTSRKANSKLAKCEVALREKRIFTAVEGREKPFEDAPNTDLNTKNTRRARARAREAKSKPDIIDDWLHKINREAGEDIANKGAEDYEEMCFILSNYSWEEEVAPAIKENQEVHFAERLRAVVKQVTGEEYG